ncbi:MAG: hypothetical protein WD358_07740 [Nitriliruptoraceae bacterium]
MTTPSISPSATTAATAEVSSDTVPVAAASSPATVADRAVTTGADRHDAIAPDEPTAASGTSAAVGAASPDDAVRPPVAENATRDGAADRRPRDRRSVAVLGDRVLVAPPTDAERRSKGGILIPATAASIDRKGIWGEAIGVGPHVRHVNVGDEVLYVPEDAIEVDVQGDAYLIVRERDVHAVGSSRRDGATGLYL